MLHAKVPTIDGAVALVGSPNFNHRSMKQDDEVCLVVPDAQFTGTLEAHFKSDLQKAERLTQDGWEDRGPVRRMAEKVAQLFKPQV